MSANLPLKSRPRRSIPGRLLPMRPMSRLVALLLCFVLLSASAAAQRPTRRILSRPWTSPPAAQPSDVRAAEAPVASAPTDDTPRTGPARRTAPAALPGPPAEAVVGVEAFAPAVPALSVFGRTGLRVTLPDGWSEPAAVDESRLPAYALYSFRATSGPLAGATLRVEQVVGLNPAEEQQWRTGRTERGYGGTRPTGPASVGGALVAFETVGAGTGGTTAFFQRGRTFWAVQAHAPSAVWAAHREDVLALFSGVALPAPQAP